MWVIKAKTAGEDAWTHIYGGSEDGGIYTDIDCAKVYFTRKEALKDKPHLEKSGIWKGLVYKLNWVEEKMHFDSLNERVQELQKQLKAAKYTAERVVEILK